MALKRFMLLKSIPLSARAFFLCFLSACLFLTRPESGWFWSEPEKTGKRKRGHVNRGVSDALDLVCLDCGHEFEYVVADAGAAAVPACPVCGMAVEWRRGKMDAAARIAKGFDLPPASAAILEERNGIISSAREAADTAAAQRDIYTEAVAFIGDLGDYGDGGGLDDMGDGYYSDNDANYHVLGLGAYEGQLDRTVGYRCVHCGDADPGNVVVDYSNHCYVARCCGRTFRSNPVPPWVERETADVVRSGTTYNKDTHDQERLGQDARLDPEICGEDHLRIKQAIAALPGGSLKSKTDVRRLLTALNKEYKTTLFTKKYLEKWKSILADYCDVIIPPTVPLDRLAEVRALASELNRAFGELKKQKHPLFVSRKHQPNLNAKFRAIFACLGIPFDPAHWPVPKTEKCTKNSNAMLEQMFLFIHRSRLEQALTVICK